jgi:aldose 1-epimerase
MIAPSGEQITIAAGDQQAVIVEVGGGLRSYSIGERSVIDGFSANEMSSSGRGQILLPWPNRLEDGYYQFDGEYHQLPLTEPARHNAIHGLVRWAPWSTVLHEPHRVVMEYILYPQPGFPFLLVTTVEYSLTDSGLQVKTTATNRGEKACPFGSGAHPYLKLDTTTVDCLTLHLPARTILQCDDRGLPIGTLPVKDTEYDFRTSRRIGTTILDHAFTDLDRGQDGLVRVELRNSERETSVLLWADQGYPYLMLFSGDPLPNVRRRSLAVEPMTCPPNAFRTKKDLTRLAPGSSFVGRWGIASSNS